MNHATAVILSSIVGAIGGAMICWIIMLNQPTPEKWIVRRGARVIYTIDDGKECGNCGHWIILNNGTWVHPDHNHQSGYVACRDAYPDDQNLKGDPQANPESK